LTGDLPQFLSALGVGTPAIRIFFDIFLSEHGLEGSPSMIEIQHILDQEVVGIKGGDEQFVDPVTDALAHRHRLAWRRSSVSSHNHACGRQSLIQGQPASLKQLDDLTGAPASHACSRWMSQDALDLGMLEDLISSPPR
jgi:hypothetical protein